MLYITKIKDTTPEPGKGIRLAVFQPAAKDSGTIEAIEANLQRLDEAARGAKAHSAHILSTPEMYMTGYAITPELAREFAQTADGPILQRVSEIAKKNEIAILYCFPEKAMVAGKERIYDAMVLYDKEGKQLRIYRKTHLWGPDERRFFSFGYVYEEEGEAYEVVKVNDFPIGLLNCYEAEFPELSRIFALKGAKLVIIPTAADEYTVLSTGQKTFPPYPDISENIITANALHNIYFQTYNNRCCEESFKGEVKGKYLGNSVIADPHGKMMCQAPHDKECILIADCIPDDYAPIHPENTDYIINRRPELYNELIDKKVNYEGGLDYPAEPV